MTEDDAATRHYLGLQALYHGAPCNQAIQPRLVVGEGHASIRFDVQPDMFHAAHALHGSYYFKALDDAAFFAANSIVRDVFVLTGSFQIDLIRPVTEGTIRAEGRVVHAGRQRIVADSILYHGGASDDGGRMIGRGSGSFMRSHIELDASVGYDPAASHAVRD